VSKRILIGQVFVLTRTRGFKRDALQLTEDDSSAASDERMTVRGHAPPEHRLNIAQKRRMALRRRCAADLVIDHLEGNRRRLQFPPTRLHQAAAVSAGPG